MPTKHNANYDVAHSDAFSKRERASEDFYVKEQERNKYDNVILEKQ